MIPLVLVSTALLALRMIAAARVGYGDSEALYASWAIHPQAAYLDHPGLIALFARTIGGGEPPLPGKAHLVTALAATFIPWVLLFAARACGAARERAMWAAIAFAVVPEIGIGLFALTPDLLLAPLWLGAIGFAAKGLTTKPGEVSASTSFLLAGLCAGAAAAAKVSGLLVFASLAFAYASIMRARVPEAKAARSIWPWAGLACGLVVFSPVVLYEAHHGLPMLRHRLVDTQPGAGVALRNLAALFGGQLLYVSPVLLFIAMTLGWDLWRTRNTDAISRLLFATFALPAVPLLFLSAWSPVAEPHWLAPPLLALAIHGARSGAVGVKVYRAGVVIGGAMVAIVHLWILVPAAVRLFPRGVDARADISRELYGWPAVLAAVRDQSQQTATPFDPGGRDLILVGPHWTVCAQIAAGLPNARVGCATPIPDDFDGWLPRDLWKNADDVLFVSDDRFPDDDGTRELPNHLRVSSSRVRTMRGGRPSRLFTLTRWSRRAESRLQR